MLSGAVARNLQKYHQYNICNGTKFTPKTLVGVREAMEETVVTPHFYCNADAWRQKGNNFRAIRGRVLIGSFDITVGS